MTGRSRTERRILTAIHEGARDLFAVGAIDAAKMSEFDEICRDGQGSVVPEGTASQNGAGPQVSADRRETRRNTLLRR